MKLGYFFKLSHESKLNLFVFKNNKIVDMANNMKSTYNDTRGLICKAPKQPQSLIPEVILNILIIIKTIDIIRLKKAADLITSPPIKKHPTMISTPGRILSAN